MAYLLSKVRVDADGIEHEFIAPGTPRNYDDLEGLLTFDEFLEETKVETDIHVHVESYIVGGGDVYIASLDDAHDYDQIVLKQPDYLEKNATFVEELDFDFSWTPTSSEFDDYPYLDY